MVVQTRVLPPQQAHPNEDLVALVFFYRRNPHNGGLLSAPIGRVDALEPVVSGEFVRERVEAITRT